MFFVWSLSVTTTTLLGLTAALVAFLYYKRHYNHLWKSCGIEFDSPRFFLGTIYSFLRGKGLQEIDIELYQKYGRIFGAYQGIKPLLYVSDPEYLKMIMVKDFHSFVNRRDLKTNDPIFDKMLPFTIDDEWKRIRSIITPSFTTGKIKKMMGGIGHCATQSTNNFKKFADNQEPADCKKLFGNFTLDVISNVAFGTQLDSHNDPDNAFVTNARKTINRKMNLKSLFSLLMPKLANMFGIQFFNLSFFTDLTRSIIKRRMQSKEVRHDFVQLLMDSLEDSNVGETLDKPIKLAKLDLQSEQNGTEDEEASKKKKLSLDELTAQCVIFFLAGYETAATTLAMVCYNLALHPEAQKKVQQEIDGFWKKGVEIDSNDIQEARYLDAVVSETLRLFPPTTRTERRANDEYTLGATGICIPKDTLIVIPIYSMHRDPEFFQDPDLFQPERFLPENRDSINQYTYMPFGAGPRNCVAMRFALMEIKLNLMYLLKEIEFDVCSETKIPPEFNNGSGILQPKSICLKVTRRTNS